MSHHSFLAFDMGAASGRAILGQIKNHKLHLQELYRFPNRSVLICGHLHWNIFDLFEEMKKGIVVCISDKGVQPESLAIDTWGVDFGFLSDGDSILGLPYSYRDSRTDGIMEEFLKILPREKIYRLTGVQFLQFNSLFQLYALVRNKSPILDQLSDVLFIPDLFNFFFTGEKATEFTVATTSQLYNPVEKDWEKELFEAIGISRSVMQKIVQPGTIIGELRDSVVEETKMPHTPVVATASHDTGSAVAAVPGEGHNWAYISSGTWSCMGIETFEPIITEKAMRLNFTNEGGIEGTFRVLKNIMGLWLLQECRRSWKKNHNLSYDEQLRGAERASAFKRFIDPDWKGFLIPPDMPGAICEFCNNTGQTKPESPAEFVRCVLESLALKYRYVMTQIKEISPKTINRIHIIGGGSQNELLCQFTANATGIPVLAGPVEAAAVGNILVQAFSSGLLKNHEEMRRISRLSFQLKHYEPRKVNEWNTAYERFLEILEKNHLIGEKIDRF